MSKNLLKAFQHYVECDKAYLALGYESDVTFEDYQLIKNLIANVGRAETADINKAKEYFDEIILLPQQIERYWDKDNSYSDWANERINAIKDAFEKINIIEQKYVKTAIDYLYAHDVDEMSFVIVEEKPTFAIEKRSQVPDFQHELFEDVEYVMQTTGYLGDDYYGQIARKFRDSEKWVIITYMC